MSFKSTFTLSEVYNKQLSGVWPTAFYDYFEKTSVLIGTNEVTYIDDASTNKWMLTPTSVKASNEHPYQPGYYSNYFATSASYITTSAIFMGATAFTVECFVNTINKTAYAGICKNGTTAEWGVTDIFVLGLDASGNSIYAYNGTGGISLNGATTISDGNWHHIAFVYDGTNYKLYIDGVLNATQAVAAMSQTARVHNIGSDIRNSRSWVGHISNYRVVNGTALYTANFVPPTSPLTAISGTVLLTCVDSYFSERITPSTGVTVTGTPSIKSFTPFSSSIPAAYSSYGSAYLNSAYMNNTAFTGANFGTSADFTVGTWMKWEAAAGGNQTSYEFYGTTRMIVGRTTSGVRFFLNGTERGFSYTFIPNVWYHIAIVRSLLYYYVYINGKLANTPFTQAVTHSYTTLTIGRNYDSAETSAGLFLSDFSVVNGTAVWGGDFIPPTEPLTAITNTTLLTFQNNKEILNSTFYDNSSVKNLITTSASPTQGTFSQISPAGWSTYLNNSGYLQTTAYNVACTGDFTFECWAYITTYESTSAFFTIGSEASGRHYFAVQNSGQPWTNTYGGSSYTWGTSTSVPLNAWTHIAWVRIGSTVTCYVNGISIGTNSISATIGNSGGVTIGANPSGGYLWTGNLYDVRLVNGIALYTSNFLPPTNALTAVPGTMLLTCQDNRFKDNSVNAIGFTVTSTPSIKSFSPYYPAQKAIGTTVDYVGNSTYFNGSSDYLTIASNSVFAFNTSDFTIEFWINPTSDARQDWFDFNTSGTRLLMYTSSGSIIYHIGGVGSAITSGTTYTKNVWQHIALVRISGSTKLYLNGVQTGSTYADTSNYSAQGLSIGKDAAGSTYITGFMSNLRMVKGTGVYTTSFTPPTAPLTAIPGTSLLTCQNSLFTDNSGNALTITRNGSPKISPSSPFTSTTNPQYNVADMGSMLLAAGNDCLSFASSPLLGLLTNDFTIDAWVYPTSTAQFTIISMTGNSIQVFLYNGSFYWYGDGQSQGSGPSIILNAWSHIAVSRNNGVLRCYINGVVCLSIAKTTSFAAGTAEIGRNGTNGGGSNGYISSVRVINGVGMYPTEFSPSTILKDVPGTVILYQNNNAGIYDATGRNNILTNGDTKLRSNIKKYGNNSMYFDGTGDKLTIPYSPVFDVRAGDFTIQFWINPAASPAQSSILNFSSSSAAAPLWIMFDSGVIRLRASSNGSAWDVASSLALSGTLTLNTWYHFALTRSGGVWKSFVDGSQYWTATNAASLYVNGLPLNIGAYSDNVLYYNGYIDDLRIIKGTAKYTAAFTPPPRLGLVP